MWNDAPGGLLVTPLLGSSGLNDVTRGIRNIFQSGIPFWMPPGDGGATGLSFSGVRGVFALSAAAPMADAWGMLSTGGYAYMPAGSGGLAAGWYWCVMTSATAGELYTEMHVPGSNPPAFITSPTALPNCSAGRITQVTTEVTAVSLTMPGGSMGPNGMFESVKKWVCSSTGGNKSFAVRVANTLVFKTTPISTNNNQIVRATRQNMGTQSHQCGNRIATALSAWDAGASATTYFAGDDTSINTAVDCTVAFTMQNAVNTDSSILVPMQFQVTHGA